MNRTTQEKSRKSTGGKVREEDAGDWKIGLEVPSDASMAGREG